MLKSKTKKGQYLIALRIVDNQDKFRKKYSLMIFDFKWGFLFQER